MKYPMLVIHSGFLALACLSSAQSADRPVYTCPKVAEPPVIDGRLDDQAWQRAPEVILVLSETGAPAAKRTTARMCWDDENLYVAFDCVDTDIWGTFTNRDDTVYQEEVVEIFLDPDRDLVRYFEINVSPRSTVFDALIVNPNDWEPGDGTSPAWNCEGLRTAVVVNGTLDDRTDTDRGWSVEMAIPFAGLGQPAPRPGERWRANLYRIDLTPEPAEFQAWSPTMVSPARYHIPSRFGTIFFSAASP